MKRKDRDRILESVLESNGMPPSQFSGEASQELQLAQDIRQGLAGLAGSVPEPVRSVESLRTAILHEGLKESRAGISWVWAVPSMALGALAWMAFSGMGAKNTSVPSVVVAPPPVSVAQNDNLLPEPTFDMAPQASFAVSTNETPKAAPRTPRKTPRRTRDNTTLGMVAESARKLVTSLAMVADTAKPKENTDSVRVASYDQTQGPAPEMAVLGPPPSNGTPQIVLIDSSRDQDTGASAAMEVESLANVVVGG